MKGVVTTIFILSFTAQSTAQSEFIIATGSKYGTYTKIVQDLKDVCKSTSIRLKITRGTGDNISLLFDRKSKIDFAIAQLDVLYFLKYFERSDIQKQLEQIRMVVPLYFEEIHLLVRTDRNINSLKDLKSRKVNIGPPGSGTFLTANIIQYKTSSQWDVQSERIETALKNLIDGKIDAMFLVIGQPTPILFRLPKEVSNQIKLISIKHPKLATFYLSVTIPGNSYKWQPKLVQTYKIRSAIITNRHTTKKKVQMIDICLRKHIDALRQKGHAKWKQVKPRAKQNSRWPYHSALKESIKSP